MYMAVGQALFPTLRGKDNSFSWTEKDTAAHRNECIRPRSPEAGTRTTMAMMYY